MENFNNVPSSGTFGSVVSVVNQNFALAKEAIDKLAFSKSACMGFYETSSELNDAHPTPTDGDWALVGNSSPFNVYVANDGSWVDSGVDYNVSVDNSIEINGLGGYVVLDSIQELPASPTNPNLGYLIGTHLYVYVGTGGNTADGKYQDCGEFRGPEGKKGEPGADGHDGVSLGEVAIVDNLTEGGSDKVLSAEMGKELEVKKMDKVEIVNDLFGGEETDVLGAEQGAVLDKKIISLYSLFESLGMEVPYIDKHWLDVGYGIGDNLSYRYNAWGPNCAHYDRVRGRIMYMQCHKDRHANVQYYNSQLWAINPYNVLEKELIAEFEPITTGNRKTNLSFEIDSDGVYWTMNDLYVYRSDDRGATWTRQSVVTKPRNIYGMWIIDGKMIVGDDGNGDKYWVSTDGGINFTEHTFGLGEEYTIAHCEATFAKFQGRLYAAIRRDDALGILLRQGADETWSVLCENLPNLNSDCSLYATKDTLLFAAINRPDRTLTYGTITIGEEGVVNKIKVFSMDNYCSESDFHCPALVYTTDFACITFFINAAGGDTLRTNNACVVAYYDLERNENLHYIRSCNGIQNRGAAWFKASPYIGVAPTINDMGFTSGLARNSIYDCSIDYPNSFATKDGVMGRVIPNVSNTKEYYHYDGWYINGKYYCCTMIGKTVVTTRMELLPMRFIFAGKFEEHDYSSIGTIQPEGSQLSMAVEYLNATETSQFSWLATLCPPIKKKPRITKNDVVVFTALESCVFTLTIGSDVDRYAIKRIHYSIDAGRTWVSTDNVDGETVIIETPTIGAGESVWWRGEGDRLSKGTSVEASSHFNSSGRFDVGGNILGLVYGNDINDTKYAYSAAGWGYEYAALFMGCTTLVHVAKDFLAKATIVGSHSYDRMFAECTSLVSAPNLPAKNINGLSYNGMFMGCTSLVIPPYELPADVLPDPSYQDMFSGCTSLAESPIIRPHRILAQQKQLQRMFDGCSSLRKITILNGEYGGIVTQQWVRGVPTGSGGTFVTSGTWTTRGQNGVPAGWEIVTVDADTLEPVGQ